SGLCGSPRRSNGCARFVLDGVIPAAEVQELAKLLQWLVSEAWGAGSGPPSVVDLHAETISYKDNFVNLTMFMEFKSLKFSQKQVAAYQAVRRVLREQLSRLFGVPLEGLQHDMTFFSHINGSKTAQTTHDEYWHSHIDTEQYGTFAYTVLLYLNTADDDR
ncbi:ogfod3, partial [Symbiodinium pilosum]